ncbi:sugar phosphate isomerase/epimerase family protein [Pontibacter chitinilyticus]|uniref:sugar phosphate isomerase/epimerase family protein n=1 Tax=Pontibacter chitinilyticus TaxID=2674989 RepID=UPI0032192A8B
MAESDTAAATAGGAAENKPTPVNVKTVGLQLYTLRDVIGDDVKGALSKVSQAGYADVETFGYSKDKGFWGLDPKAFKQALDNSNLISSSGHYGMEDFLVKGDEDLIKHYAEVGNAVGQTYITCPWLPEQLRQTAADYKALSKKLNRAGEILKDANLQLAYHNHNFEFQKVGDTTGYDIMLQETDPDLVKFEADLYWVVRAGKDPLALFQEAPGRFVMWHVKDMDKNQQDLNTEVGNGSIDYKKIFNQGNDSGVKRIFMEQENFASNMDPYKSIAQSASYIKNTLLQA